MAVRRGEESEEDLMCPTWTSTVLQGGQGRENRLGMGSFSSGTDPAHVSLEWRGLSCQKGSLGGPRFSEGRYVVHEYSPGTKD